ncbi:transglutaminase family protein [Methylobacterium brachythecii]|uniref:Transglutaminase n=1 Tax=Methylobacterium brachythecii TaxID=1176177 RepID=A0A7W6F8P6_9HYPH|nr:transglutaminase family protein [Methylobacterium brachythecii]MBB3904683.1 transglutaminase-like putative cysteine protease [Methylobacterium brachythecii]GLS46793.1 transglutaminase [Methylobacterium brachythecii]
MRIRVVHDTIYTYEQAARGLIQVLRLTPRDHDGQHVREWRIEPSADGRLTAREDGFGNIVHWFTADEAADALTVRVTGEVETFDTAGIVRGAMERLPEPFYLRETPLTEPSPEIQAFAEEATSGGVGERLSVLHQLLTAVPERVVFEPGPTSASTTAAASFEAGKGVCQDMSHIFIAAARHLEIPTRYVSGYFRRDDGVDDQHAGHAWAEALVPGLGWVGFDAANGISTTEAHIRVAIGLDYLGAAPIRGSRIGGGKEGLEVRLRVEGGIESHSQSQSQGRQSQSQG